MSSRRLSALIAALAALLVLTACGDGDDRPGEITEETSSGSGTGSHPHMGSGATTTTAPTFAKAAASQVVSIALRDFAFVDMPAEVQGPKVFFEARNEGPSEHEIVIITETGNDVAEQHEFPKGESRALAVELAPGTYEMHCLVKEEGSERTHADLGMRLTFRVT